MCLGESQGRDVVGVDPKWPEIVALLAMTCSGNLVASCSSEIMFEYQ